MITHKSACGNEDILTWKIGGNHLTAADWVKIHVAGLICLCVGACSKRASGGAWAMIRVGNAGSGLAGALTLRCKNPGKAQLPCLTVPWETGTKQGVREGAAVSQSAALTFPMFSRSAVPALAALSAQLSAGIALRAGRHSGVTQPLLILPALEFSPLLALAQRRAGAGRGDGLPGSSETKAPFIRAL